MYQVCYTRYHVSFSLWLIGSVLKHCKVTKYYEQNCRFKTKKWVKVYGQSGNTDDRYKPKKQIRFKTSMLRSDLCDYSDAYIVVKGDITVKKAIVRNFIDTRNRFLAFKKLIAYQR